MSNLPKAHYSSCSICSKLRDFESAVTHVLSSEEDTDFPLEVAKLKVIREISTREDLMRCPECETHYLYRSTYEYLIGYGGSYDEYTLQRITDEVAQEYLDGNNTKPASKV